MSERRGDLRGAREERLFVKVLACEGNPDLEELTLSGSTEDVSSSGIALAMEQPIPVGTHLEIWVEIKGFPGKFLLQGEVRWNRPKGDEFSCGIELVDSDELSDLDEWQALFN